MPINLPPYPFMAAAEYPGVPTQKVGDGPYLVEATAGESAAEGLARIGFAQADGLSVASSAANAAVRRDAEQIIARADSNAQGVVVGPLTLGQVKSTAEVTTTGDGKLQRTSSLQIVGASVGDNLLGLTPSGTVAGTGPSPVSVAEQLAALNKALEPTRMKVSLFPANETATGVESPALEIRLPFPTQSGEGVLTIIVGATSASVDASHFDDSLPTDDPLVDADVDSSATAPPSTADAASLPGAPAGSDATARFGLVPLNLSAARSGPDQAQWAPASGEELLADSVERQSAGESAALINSPGAGANLRAAGARSSRPINNFQVGSLYGLLLGLAVVGLAGSLASARRR